VTGRVFSTMLDELSATLGTTDAMVGVGNDSSRKASHDGLRKGGH
jgi:hypothetical protein